MFENMGGNIPAGNFLGGNSPCGKVPGGVWWVGIFRVGIFRMGVFLLPVEEVVTISQDVLLRKRTNVNCTYTNVNYT